MNIHPPIFLLVDISSSYYFTLPVLNRDIPIDKIKDIIKLIFELMDNDNILFSTLEYDNSDLLHKIILNYFNSIVSISKDEYINNINAVYNYHKFMINNFSGDFYKHLPNNLSQYLQIEVSNNDELHNHISNGIKYNVGNTSYKTFCKDCLKSFEINTQFKINNVSLVNINESFFDVYVIYIQSLKTSLVLVNVDFECLKIILYINDFTLVKKINDCTLYIRNSIEDMIHLCKFNSVCDVRLELDKIINDSATEFDLIISFITNNFNITNNIDDKINSTILINKIINDLELIIDSKLSFTKRVSQYLEKFNIKKKRMSDGIYYYGLKLIE